MIELAALKAANAPLNAFVDWDEAATGGEGPLAGLTVGVKSNIMVAGLPWTGGMGLYRDRIADRDAKVLAKLRAAGAAILGTLNMHEAALGATTDNAFYGRTHNPHRIGHTPGGSSGGSGAAVAAGLCDIALGTDTLGSVRIPAAYCGVYGLKPTPKAVSEDGLAYLEPSFDCIGPLARSLDMIERAWPVVADVPGESRAFDHLILLDDLAGVETHPAVRAAYERACAAIDLAPSSLSFADSPTDIRMAGFGASGRWLIGDLGERRTTNADGLSDELKFMLGVCEMVPDGSAILARTRDTMCAAIGESGVLLMPTTPDPAFEHGTRAPVSQADFTSLANIAGLPAISLPAGWTEDGLPVAVQLVGPAGSEPGLIALARTLDGALNAYSRPPYFYEGET